MFTLGIHGWMNTQKDYIAPFARNWAHDAAAALCDNGKIVAAAEEERFLRLKHVNFFPLESIRFCIKQYGISLADIDHIAIASYHSEYKFFSAAQKNIASAIWDYRRNLFESYCDLVANILNNEFSVNVRNKLVLVDHQQAHAQSAFSLSGFNQALVVVLDGWGDESSGLIGKVKNGLLEIISPIKSSLGAFYAVGTYHLGYSSHDEYKVMGLAPYGDPTIFRKTFRSLYELLPDGQFKVDTSPTAFMQIFGPARLENESIEQHHKDFASGLQAATEEIIMHMISHYRESTGNKYLCMAGGVAQNSSVNGKILKSGLFEDVFVQPASYDAGLAIGSALHIAIGNKPSPLKQRTSNSPGLCIKVAANSHRIEHSYWGSPLPNAEDIFLRLRSWKSVVTHKIPDDIYTEAANLLADGKIIGWLQGRSEFGPRALGNRSILADPRFVSSKHVVNSMVKQREHYRPFAPAVVEEALHEYFVVPKHIRCLPFMTFVVPVREEKIKYLQGVTHIDGTARVQTVSKDINPRFWRLLMAFKDLTGIPIVLNTSFNINGQPMVDSLDDALNCFLTSGIDQLVAGDQMISKIADSQKATLNLACSLLPGIHIIESHELSSIMRFQIRDIHSNSGAYIPEIVAQTLRNSHGRIPLREALALTDAQSDPIVIGKILDLWRTNFIRMNPID